MNRHQLRRPVHRPFLSALATVCSLAFAATLPAETVVTGDVTPSLPWGPGIYAYVGNTGSGTLIVSAGSELASSFGYLGYESGARGAATVTGAGSWWSSKYGLEVGHHGGGTLRVEDGGLVSSGWGYLGYSAGSIGAATITGTGSQWSNDRFLYVGCGGSGTLTVANGGQVTTGTLLGSLGDLRGDGVVAAAGAVLDTDLQFDASHAAQNVFSFGSGGTLTVTPATGGYLGAGYKSIGSLTIADGVGVCGSSGYLGYWPGSSGNATVAGADSIWRNSGTVYVGLSGNGALRVEAGGAVTSEWGYVGSESGATGEVIVSGPGSRWDNKQWNGGYSSLYLHIGHEGTGSLRVEDGGYVRSSSSRLGGETGSTGEATVTGLNSGWFNSGDFYVGERGSGTFRVADGGGVGSGNAYLGSASGATGHATITGTGSHWNNTGELYVGRYGSGTLTVEDGGQVTTGALYASFADLYGDGTITASGAVLDVNLRFDASRPTQNVLSFGSGGTLTVTPTSTRVLGAGHKGQGSLTIADGVAISGSSGHLGYDGGATGETTVTGPGSQWNSSSALYVGNRGRGTLRVEAGALVSNGYGYVGYDSGATGEATITGPSSQWQSGGYLYVGREGSGTLRIEDGGQVGCRWGYLAYGADATGTATVSGTNSRWDVGSVLYVGDEGAGTLRVEDGGQVSCLWSYLGYESGATGSATIIGDGSRWDISSNIYVGYEGSGTLTVDNGAQVTASSLFASLDDLHGDGTITVSEGAVLDADIRFDAYQPTQNVFSFGSGGTLTVTTAGGKLGAGYKGRGILTIADGVAVSSYESYLGYWPDSSGDATVTGPGSQWISDNRFNIGYYGSGTLRVEDGGRVSSIIAWLGLQRGSTGDATITGAASQWNNSSDLTVSRGTLAITAGGLVTVGGTLSIGYDCVVNMATGGMLALGGEAGDSLAQFVGLVEGTGAFRYWDDDLADWAPITDATYGDDYTLEYLTTGDLAGYTLLTVGTPGDFNGDGVVDAADYSVWRDGLGAIYTEADYQIWKTHFGQTAGGGLLSDYPVPEPSTMVLLLFAALATFGRRVAGRRFA